VLHNLLKANIADMAVKNVWVAHFTMSYLLHCARNSVTSSFLSERRSLLHYWPS